MQLKIDVKKSFDESFDVSVVVNKAFCYLANYNIDDGIEWNDEENKPDQLIINATLMFLKYMDGSNVKSKND